LTLTIRLRGCGGSPLPSGVVDVLVDDPLLAAAGDVCPPTPTGSQAPGRNQVGEQLRTYTTLRDATDSGRAA
jgi:hypothetical protein